MEKIKKRIANLKVAGGLVSVIGISAGFRDNDCQI